MLQHSKSFTHFAKHLFLVSKVHVETKKAREDVNEHLEKMRKSIIRMSLSYTDIDKLKEKIRKAIDHERKYAKFFKADDKETQELRSRMNALEQELANDREEKQKIVSENDDKVKQLTESLTSIKNQMRHLLMERAKRHQRLKSLEKKIKEKVDVHKYFSS